MQSSLRYILTLLVLSVNIFCGLPCPPGKKTDDPQGRCCVFPFEYGGVTYQSCTNGWCSFDEVYVGNWANCVNPCTNNPCQNGGDCTVTGDDSYSCKCADGYYGESCEKVSPCKSHPCKNGGTCTMTGLDSFSCKCTDDFEGDTCEKRLPCLPGKKTDDPQGRCCVFPFEYGGVTYQSCTNGWCSFDKVYVGNWANCVNPCTNNPCQNGGDCTVTGDDSYSCKCADGYYGESCEKVSPCKSHPCKNGGTCTMTGLDSFFCKCTDDFEGDTCEKRLPCLPGKKTDDPQGRCCVFPFDYGGVTYQSCTNGWCSFDEVYVGNWANCVNPCTNNPCQNGGDCTVTGDDSYSCKCADGYYGESCEKVSPCKSHPCKNGGTCTMTGLDSFSCKCTDDFEGDTCEKRLPCPPGKKTDDPQGRCCVFPFEYGGVTYQSCTNGWCSFDEVYVGNWANCVNPCTNNPCQNGGDCTVTGDDSYSCKCADGYYGESCEKVSPCKSHPCKNGGTCTMTGLDSFSCKCTDDFEGDTCEKRLPCLPGKKTDDPQGRCCVFPFEYGGVTYQSCTNGWCSFDEVYVGNWANCVNPCTNNPCQNGGDCTVTGDDSYSCKCADGYYGESCEKVSPCKSHPCKNGGTCTMTGLDSFFCKCTDDFEGDTCEKRLPCPPGKKTDDPQGRCCVFPFEYGGVTYQSCTNGWCSFDEVYVGNWANCVNPCTNNPCQNGGDCKVTGDDSYSCKCADGYYGETCEKVSPCKSHPCKNGGTCTMTGLDSFSCKCTDDFEGDTCEKRLPCLPGKKTDDPQGRCCVFPFEYGGVTYQSCTNGWCSFDEVYVGNWANCVNPCTNNPCQNGGDCTVTGDDSYSCKCADGYYGESCEKVSPCKSHPCKNGGTCTMTGLDSFFCKCTDDFEGDTCEKRLPCPPGKKTDDPQGRCCVFPFEYGGVTYQSCTNGWCSFDEVYVGNWANCVNPCTNNPCQNGGDCTVTGDDSYSCKCADGYYGESCEKVSPCKSHPCKNGGTCTMTGLDSFSCKCTDDFEGDTCEKRLPCPPGKKTDDSQGRCCVFPFEYGGVTYQSCTNGWCSFDEVYVGNWANCVNPCTKSPCQNGGDCTVTGDDSYSCKCADGYYGETCEKVSPCKSHPCKNGGTCTMTGLDSFSCKCTDDFEGDTCEKRLPCTPGKKTDDSQGRCCVFPFEYGGITYQSCTKVAHHRLWCSFDKVYKGQWAYCVDECESSPCKNGASCKITQDGYSCQPCPAGWDGKNCDEVAWKSEGCFKEHKRKAKMVLGRKIATVHGKKLSIQDVFEKCKIAAEKKGFKIFGIRNRNRCFTTSDGKVQEFKKYGVSSKCKIDDNGLGVGMKLANFVYTR
nr:neurogenic locus notch homolog protein 2-like isoform X2 [Pocillopora verrucosa]